MAFGLSAGAVNLIGMGAGALLGGGGGGAQQSGTATTTQQQQLDPRIAGAIFGNGGDNSGLLGRYTGMLDTPQSPMMAQYGDAMQHYLGNAPLDMGNMHSSANYLMGGNQTAPQMTGATVAPVGSMRNATVAKVAPMTAATVNAPTQNGLDLSGAYTKMIGGDAGANPYLTSALKSAVGQTNASYDQNQTSATNNLLRTVLPSIRSGAMAVGGYGGSRQGIAEGNALSDFTSQLTNANLQLGLANSANTTGQQANSFNQGQDRSLSAMSGLGAQQYGVAQQDSSQQQQANQTNYSGALQAALTNAGFAQQGYQTTYQGAMQKALADAGYTQGASQANQGAALTTNNLNSADRVAGLNANSGLLSQAYGVGGNQDAYALSRAGQVNGLLSPYLGLNGSSTTTQPLYTNTGGNILGGALAGGALGRMVNGNNTNGLLGNFTDNNGGGQFISNLVGWGGPGATL